MKKVHELALKQVVVDQEGLQKAWNNPGVVPMLANREALVTLVVAKDKDGFYYWNVAIRIRRKDKKVVKKTALWTASDTYAARKILYGMIQDVGDSTTEEEFPSQWALHVQRRLRAEERDIILRDDILGKGRIDRDEQDALDSDGDSAADALSADILETKEDSNGDSRSSLVKE